MSRSQIKIIFRLADLYKLRTNNLGCAHRRFPVLTKTEETEIPTMNTLREFFKKEPDFSETKLNAYMLENTEPLDDYNIGKQMLISMGWDPNTGLGAQGNGAIEPLKIRIKMDRKGIGSN